MSCNKCGCNLNKSVNYCPVCGEKVGDDNISSAELLKRIFSEEPTENPRRKGIGFIWGDGFAS